MTNTQIQETQTVGYKMATLADEIRGLRVGLEQTRWAVYGISSYTRNGITVEFQSTLDALDRYRESLVNASCIIDEIWTRLNLSSGEEDSPPPRQESSSCGGELQPEP